MMVRRALALLLMWLCLGCSAGPVTAPSIPSAEEPQPPIPEETSSASDPAVPQYMVAFPGEYRGRTNTYVGGISGPAPTPLIDAPADVSAGSWSLDGTQLLFRSNHEDGLRQFSHIYIRDVVVDSTWRVTAKADFFRAPRWAPDGVTIAVWVGKRLELTMPEGVRKVLHTQDADQVSSAVWSPAGDRLVYASRSGNPFAGEPIVGAVRTVRLDGSVTDVAAGPYLYGQPRWSTSGWLAFSWTELTAAEIGYWATPRQVTVVQPDGTTRQIAGQDGTSLEYPIWDTDDERIIAVTGEGSNIIVALDPVSGAQQVLYTATDQASYPSLSPDGELLSFFLGASFEAGSYVVTPTVGGLIEFDISGEHRVWASSPVLWAPLR
jgi:Tol biopolymer transport system component